MWFSLKTIIVALRGKRWAQLFVANLRIFIGLAFLPASIKKLLGQPFTDPEKTGVFHEFLHAFHGVDGFYQLVGALQFLVACLLMTQRFATLGALLALPLLVAISALCWSSAGIPTVTVVSLMTMGIVGLLLWEFERWSAILVAEGKQLVVKKEAVSAHIDRRLWGRCGAAIIVLYLLATWSNGGVYRPRGVELHNPAFYLLPLVLLFPFVTWLVDRSRYRAHSRVGSGDKATEPAPNPD